MEQANKLSKKGQCCLALVQVKRAVTEIERELEKIGEYLSTRVLITMRDGYVMRLLIPPGVGLPIV
jgi:ATP-dependent Lon protease